MSEETLCRVIEALYAYGTVDRVGEEILIDDDRVLLGCKRLGVEPRVCREQLNRILRELEAGESIVIKLGNKTIVAHNLEEARRKLSDILNSILKRSRPADKSRLDKNLGIYDRPKTYYVVQTGKLARYWFKKGLNCGIEFTPSTTEQAYLIIAALLVKDDIQWNLFAKLVLNALSLGLQDCYEIARERVLGSHRMDTIMLRKQSCTEYYLYDLIVFEIKSRSKSKLLTREGQEDPVSQLAKYVEKCTQVYINQKNILGLLVTNGFASRSLLTDLIEEATKLKRELEERGWRVRIDIIDFYILYDLLDKGKQREWSIPPTKLLQELLQNNPSIAKTLLNDYYTPRTPKEAQELYNKFAENVEKMANEILAKRLNY